MSIEDAQERANKRIAKKHKKPTNPNPWDNCYLGKRKEFYDVRSRRLDGADGETRNRKGLRLGRGDV